MPRRRLLTVAAAGALAIAALAGCRAAPGKAAYVGATSYTDKQVKQVADQIGTAKVDITGTAGVTELYVMRDVAKRLITEKSWKGSQSVSATQVAGTLGVPAGSEYAKLRAEVETDLAAIKEHATPAKPTVADLRDIYDRAKAGGLITSPDQTFETVSPNFDSPELEAALGERALLADAIKRYDVVVNPRYSPARYPLLSFQGGIAAVVVPLDAKSSSPAVVDAR
jgi:hypothetical protein